MDSETITALFAWMTAHPGWIGLIIFCIATAESLTIIGVIIPGALIMFTLGAFIGLGHIAFWPAYGWSALGAVVGDAISFWIGQLFQQQIRRLWPFTRHPEMLTRSEDFFRRHGGKGVLFGRFFGPVRGTIPTVAGMMGMSWRSFMTANMVSAILWAPAYLLPGMAFGASLEVASRVAGRLVALILLLTGLLWLLVWLIQCTARLFQARAPIWIRRFHDWSQQRRLIGPISASLLDPEKGEVRGLLALAVVLLGGILLFNFSLSAIGHRLPSGLDQNLYHFFQELRTPWTDALLVFVAQWGDYAVTLPVSLAVLMGLLWRGPRLAAGHWLAACGFGVITSLFLQGLASVGSWSAPIDAGPTHLFPSHQTVLSTLVFGFLAVLIARELAPVRRWIAYLVAALLIVPVSFARLYLGVDWLSGALAGLCLGGVWVAILGLAYGHHVQQRLDWRGLLAISVGVTLLAVALHAGLHWRADVQRYRPQVAEQVLDRAAWWRHDWQLLPQQRRNFGGHQRQDLVLQWAGARTALQQRLHAAGWQDAPATEVKSLLLWLSPQVELRELPVLPQTHAGREDELTLVRYDAGAQTRWLVRFWDSQMRLHDTGQPIWLASISQQKKEPRMALLTLAVDDFQRQVPHDLLVSAWQGLRIQVVAGRHPGEQITLVAE